MSDRTRGGTTLIGWKKLRARVLARAQHRCEIALPGCSGQATSVHIAPWLNGNHRLATLETSLAACRRCHGRVDGARSRGGRGKLPRYVLVEAEQRAPMRPNIEPILAREGRRAPDAADHSERHGEA